MSKALVTIGGREYSLSCAPGEESHISELGRMIDHKLASLPASSSHNESLSLLFAALLLADELHDLRKSAGAPPQAAAVAESASRPLGAHASPERLDALAKRLEALVDVLGIAA